LCFTFLNKELEKITHFFGTLDQAIRKISKDKDVALEKPTKEKHKEQEAKTKRKLTANKESKANVKVINITIVKKNDTIVESSLSFDTEILLAPSKEALYTMLEVAPKTNQ
jgi:hypothetical protein